MAASVPLHGHALLTVDGGHSLNRTKSFSRSLLGAAPGPYPAAAYYAAAIQTPPSQPSPYGYYVPPTGAYQSSPYPQQQVCFFLLTYLLSFPDYIIRIVFVPWFSLILILSPSSLFHIKRCLFHLHILTRHLLLLHHPALVAFLPSLLLLPQYITNPRCLNLLHNYSPSPLNHSHRQYNHHRISHQHHHHNLSWCPWSMHVVR